MNPNEFKTHLTTNILPFWRTKMVDNENGGFYGRIDGNDTLHQDADKGVILNTRILWTFSAAFRKTNDIADRFTADRAYQYLMDHFLDAEHGGVFWTVDAKGNCVNDRKQVYAQAFMIYALAEYYKINGDPGILEIAKKLFYLLEQHSFDNELGGYLEAHTREWGTIEDMRLSEKDMNAEKTMNTHLHVLEAYTNLYRVWKDAELATQLKKLIITMSAKFVDPTGHFYLFFDRKWTLQSHDFSYGHDIEGSWLLFEAAEVLGDESLLSKVRLQAIQMVEAALEGLDEDGGLMYEGDKEKFIDTDKHWWPQAEALVGLVNAWQVSGKERYLELAQKVWSFTQDNLVDPNGEWYWSVSRDRKVNRVDDKAGPWKCPYHNGRAMIELMERLV
ncbi:MAG: AGE family epimerase/isomerase [Cyclobacteriaceae bacterium]